LSNEPLEITPETEAKVVTVCWLAGETHKALREASRSHDQAKGLPFQSSVECDLEQLGLSLKAVIEVLVTGEGMGLDKAVSAIDALASLLAVKPHNQKEDK